MATSTNITNFNPALKEIYRDSNVANLTYKKRPFFGLLKKFEGFGGKNLPIVLEYGNPQGRSRDFATAQANATQVLVDDFELTRVSDYAVATITSETIEATRGNKMAFLNALRSKINGAINSLSNSIETKLFRNGTGSMGQAGTYVGSAVTCVLAQIKESTLFEVNMELVSSATDGGTVNAGSATITGINRSTGVLTSDSAWDSQITGHSTGDYFYVEGDAQNGASSLSCIAGLPAWIPSTAPTAGSSFLGVDRSVDSRLFGLYYDGSSGPIEEVLQTAQSDAAQEGGAPETVFMHHAQVRKLALELGSKKDYFENVLANGAKGPMANVGYAAMKVHGSEGDMKIIAANKCQANIAWPLTLEDWTLNSLGPCVQLNDEDGLKMLRQSTADGYESRWHFRGNLATKSPIYNIQVTLPAV